MEAAENNNLLPEVCTRVFYPQTNSCLLLPSTVTEYAAHVTLVLTRWLLMLQLASSDSGFGLFWKDLASLPGLHRSYCRLQYE